MRYNFKKETSTAKIPTRHTKTSAGVDFYSDSEKTIFPGDSAIISTGVSWNPDLSSPSKPYDPSGTYFPFGDCSISMVIQSRSGKAFKNGIEASNAGVIDQDYFSTPEKKAIIMVKLYNHSDRMFYVNRGDKICQGVPGLIPYFSDVENLDDSRDGEGFGSSDEKEKSCAGCNHWEEPGILPNSCAVCSRSPFGGDVDNYEEKPSV